MAVSKGKLAWLSAIIWIFVIVTTFCTTAGSRGQSETLLAPNIPIPKMFFGMHIHHLFTGSSVVTPWPAVPFSCWRLWDSYVTWANLEPEKGKWNFATLDKYVDIAEQHHVEILLTLSWTPQWASARPQEREYGPLGAAAEPQKMADWQEYVRTVATRYKGRIHDYEIWNEPNSKGFYTGTIPQLVQIAGAAYTTLKLVDPHVTVTSPPCAGPEGVGWLDEYLRAGGGRYADVIGYHFYVNSEPPEQMVPLIHQVEQTMQKNGVGEKPLWDTETGWAIQNNQNTVKPAGKHGVASIVLAPDMAAAYLARAYVLSWASGASRLYWYAWDNGVMGLVDRDGKTLKSPALAYGQVENWLVGATMTSCMADSADTWTCAITRPGGYRGWIMWNPNATKSLVSFRIPGSWHVGRVRDLVGHEAKVEPGASVDISVMPHLLETSGH